MKLQNLSMIQQLIDKIPERFNEALLKKTELTMKKIKNVMKALNLI